MDGVDPDPSPAAARAVQTSGQLMVGVGQIEADADLLAVSLAA
jgi:hypothetical protein